MKNLIITTRSAKETQKRAYLLAQKLTRSNLVKNSALVIALEGDLGGGKTTFTQGFARGLGVREKILSPTFVVMRILNFRKLDFRKFVHIDAYRLKNAKELQSLGWKDILKDKQIIILVEWADKIRRVLPREYIRIRFEFINENERKIIMQNVNIKM
jgi:tRNA threonylcarbamoyladenosine biosynthesis protein TsaE